MKRFYFNSLLAALLIGGVLSGYSQNRSKLSPEQTLEAKKHYLDAAVLYAASKDPGASVGAGMNYYRAGKRDQALRYLKSADSLGLLKKPEEQFAYFDCLKSAGDYKGADRFISAKASESKDNALFGMNAGRQQYYEKLASYKKSELKSVAVNTEYGEFGPVEYGGLLFFSSSRPDLGNRKVHRLNMQPYFNLYATPAEGGSGKAFVPSGEFGAAEVKQNIDGKEYAMLPSGLNKKYHDGPLFVSSSGKYLFFTSNWHSKKLTPANERVTLNIYVSEKNESGWSEPKSLPFNGKSWSTQHACFDEKSSTLYFSSDRPGGLGKFDIWSSVLKDGSWSEPKNLGANVNSPGNEVFPVVSPDDGLLFSSDGRPGLGGLDIFLSDEPDRPAINMLAGVNSEADDFGMWFTEKGRGFMVSNRNGTKGDDDLWSFSVNLNDIRSENNVPAPMAVKIAYGGGVAPASADVEVQTADAATLTETGSVASEGKISATEGSVVTVRAPGFEPAREDLTKNKLAEGEVQFRLDPTTTGQNPGAATAAGSAIAAGTIDFEDRSFSQLNGSLNGGEAVINKAGDTDYNVMLGSGQSLTTNNTAGGNGTFVMQAQAAEPDAVQVLNMYNNAETGKAGLSLKVDPAGGATQGWTLLSGDKVLASGSQVPVKTGEWYEAGVEVRNDSIFTVIGGKQVSGIANPGVGGQPGSYGVASSGTSRFDDLQFVSGGVTPRVAPGEIAMFPAGDGDRSLADAVRSGSMTLSEDMQGSGVAGAGTTGTAANQNTNAGAGSNSKSTSNANLNSGATAGSGTGGTGTVQNSNSNTGVNSTANAGASSVGSGSGTGLAAGTLSGSGLNASGTSSGSADAAGLAMTELAAGLEHIRREQPGYAQALSSANGAAVSPVQGNSAFAETDPVVYQDKLYFATTSPAVTGAGTGTVASKTGTGSGTSSNGAAQGSVSGGTSGTSGTSATAGSAVGSMTAGSGVSGGRLVTPGAGGLVIAAGGMFVNAPGSTGNTGVATNSQTGIAGSNNTLINNSAAGNTVTSGNSANGTADNNDAGTNNPASGTAGAAGNKGSTGTLSGTNTSGKNSVNTAAVSAAGQLSAALPSGISGGVYPGSVTVSSQGNKMVLSDGAGNLMLSEKTAAGWSTPALIGLDGAGASGSGMYAGSGTANNTAVAGSSSITSQSGATGNSGTSGSASGNVNGASASGTTSGATGSANSSAGQSAGNVNTGSAVTGPSSITSQSGAIGNAGTSGSASGNVNGASALGLMAGRTDNRSGYFDEATSTLYFSSNRSGGQGGYDIWKSVYVNGAWSAPVNMGSAVNTSVDELNPSVSNDGYLLYSSDGWQGLGGQDVYAWKPGMTGPANLLPGINSKSDETGVTVSSGGGYFSSNRAGGKGGYDVYRFKGAVASLAGQSGKVKGTSSLNEGEGIAAGTIVGGLEGLSNDREFLMLEIEDPENTGTGSYYRIINGRLVAARDIKYSNQSLRKVTVTGKDRKGRRIRRVIEIWPARSNQQSVDKALVLYFRFGKLAFRQASVAEAERLAKSLKENSSLTLDISVHSDCMGSDASNQRMSERRAKWLVEYFEKRAPGSSGRINAKGFGETIPAINCECENFVKGNGCKRAQNDLNRRAEIRMTN